MRWSTFQHGLSMYDEEIEDILTAHGLRLLKVALRLLKPVAIGVILFAVVYAGVRRIQSSETVNKIPAIVRAASADVRDAAAVVRDAAADVRDAAAVVRDAAADAPDAAAVVRNAAADAPSAAAVVRSVAAMVRSAATEARDTGETLAIAAQDGWREADKASLASGVVSGPERQIAESLSTQTSVAREPMSTNLP